MGIRIEYTDNAQAMLKHMILLTILCAACAVENRANGQKLIDDLLAADVEGLASETCASYAPPSASATYDTPLKPPTNTKGLIPQGVGVLYANLTANPLPTSVDCGKPCFAADCYTKVPDECCAGAEAPPGWFFASLTHRGGCHGRAAKNRRFGCWVRSMAGIELNLKILPTSHRWLPRAGLGVNRSG